MSCLSRAEIFWLHYELLRKYEVGFGRLLRARDAHTIAAKIIFGTVDVFSLLFAAFRGESLDVACCHVASLHAHLLSVMRDRAGNTRHCGQRRGAGGSASSTA